MQEGFPAVAADGTGVALPCYAVAAGSPIVDSSSERKTIALVRADGVVDTSTSVSNPFGGGPGYLVAFHSVAFATYGSSFYAAMDPGSNGYVGSGNGGYFLVAYGGPATLGTSSLVAVSAPVAAGRPGFLSARTVGIYGGQRECARAVGALAPSPLGQGSSDHPHPTPTPTPCSVRHRLLP